MKKRFKQKWLRLEESRWQIIIPDRDIRPHGLVEVSKGKKELAWQDCPCEPKINLLDKIIVHNSFIDIDRINESLKKFK